MASSSFYITIRFMILVIFILGMAVLVRLLLETSSKSLMSLGEMVEGRYLKMVSFLLLLLIKLQAQAFNRRRSIRLGRLICSSSLFLATLPALSPLIMSR